MIKFARIIVAIGLTMVPVCAQAISQEVGEVHIVRSGEYLIKIAKGYQVPWQAMMLANEESLRALYEERCSKLRARYTKSTNRKGHYCNGTKSHAWANSLKPGDKLRIPRNEVPQTVSQVVGQMGTRVAIVIDDTGSMADDRKKVGELYAAAVAASRRSIVGVFLFADRGVRRYNADATVSFFRNGSYENAHGALVEAAKSRPDTIVLISDEPGDDWVWEDLPSLGVSVVAFILRS